jgi:hypothetical protein
LSRSSQSPLWRTPIALAGLASVAAARLLTLPKTLWEYDEVLFVRGVKRFDPLQHRPHPPGYPLVVGLGKLFAAIAGSPFAGLVASSVVASLVGYLALVDLYGRLTPAGAASEADRRRDALAVGVGGALLLCLSPPMLLYGPLALSDAPAVAFLALALAAGARLVERATTGEPTTRAALAHGAFAAGAVGCRPQLAVAVLPMVLAVLVAAARGRDDAARRATYATWTATLGGFAAVALAWFVPLVVACGGLGGLLDMLRHQAGDVAAHDASAARALVSSARVGVRFLAHPWGPKSLSGWIWLLAIAGFVVVARRRRPWIALPLCVLAAVDLGFALAVMDPTDAVRYALPSMLAVAFLAAVGVRALAVRARVPWLSWAAAALFCVAFVVYLYPLLRVRSTVASPPVQAIGWVQAHVPRDAVILVAPPLLPHAVELLPARHLVAADPAQQASTTAEDRPMFFLGEGDSGWPGEVLFSWPYSKAWDKLTRGYYRVVSVSPLPDGCRYSAVRGVYGFESGWRWLDREADLRVVLHGASNVGVTLGLPKIAPYDRVDVEVAAGAAPPVRISVARGRPVVAHVAAPAGTTAEIHIRAARSFVPADVGLNADRRRLAVQLLGCEVEPARP